MTRTKAQPHGRRDAQDVPASLRFVSIQQLVKSGVSRTTIWRRVKDGQLPKPFEWCGRLGWREGTIARLMQEAEEKAG